MQQVPSSDARTPRPRAVAMLALLLAVPLLAALAVPAQAQVVYIADDEADRTYGWAFPELRDPDATLADPTGDVATETPPAPVPGGTILQALDLIAVEVHEADEEVLILRIGVAELDPAQFTREHSINVPSYTITFEFGTVQHEVSGWLEPVCKDPATPLCEPYTNPTIAFHAELSHRTPADGGSFDGIVPTRVDTDANVLEVLLPRWALHRSGNGMAPPLAGDTLTGVHVTADVGFRVTSGSAVPIAVRARDQLPDDAPAADVHTLVHNSLGSAIKLALAGTSNEPEPGEPFGPGFGTPVLRPRENRIDVDLDRAPRIPIEVHNVFGRGVLVVPEATLHEAPGDLGVRVVESLSVPADETRRFDIILTGNGTIDPSAPLRITVAANTLGTGSLHMDRFDLLVRQAVTLTSETNRLYLHTTGSDSIGNLPTTMFTFVDGVLNTREDDPQDNGVGADLGIACVCGDSVDEWVSESAVLDPLFLDKTGNVTFHLTIDAPIAGALELDANLFYDDTFVAGHNLVIDLVEGTNTVDMTLPVQTDAAALDPSDSGFLLDLFAAFRPGADIPLTELTNVAHATNPRLVTQGATWLELPLIERAERFADVDHLSIDLQKGYEAVRYVNPGRGALWNVTILNQGAETDTVTVSAAADASGWKTETRPGKSFRLAPGDSVTVGVLARAPADAAEGHETRINVTASSALADGNAAGIRLSAVVTDGIAIDEATYVADNETRSKVVLDTEDRGTPGPGPVMLLAVLAAVALVERRRRRHP